MQCSLVFCRANGLVQFKKTEKIIVCDIEMIVEDRSGSKNLSLKKIVVNWATILKAQYKFFNRSSHNHAGCHEVKLTDTLMFATNMLHYLNHATSESWIYCGLCNVGSSEVRLIHNQACSFSFQKTWSSLSKNLGKQLTVKIINDG